MHSEFLPQRASCYVFSIEMNNLLYINDFCALCWMRCLLYVFNYISYLDVPHLDLLIMSPLFSSSVSGTYYTFCLDLVCIVLRWSTARVYNSLSLGSVMSCRT